MQILTMILIFSFVVLRLLNMLVWNKIISGEKMSSSFVNILMLFLVTYSSNVIILSVMVKQIR
jgi:hypothetical protein